MPSNPTSSPKQQALWRKLVVDFLVPATLAWLLIVSLHHFYYYSDPGSVTVAVDAGRPKP